VHIHAAIRMATRVLRVPTGDCADLRLNVVALSERTVSLPSMRTRWPMLAGGAGAQIIYSAVADRQSVQHAGAVPPRFLLSLGYEHHDVRLRGLHGSGTSP